MPHGKSKKNQLIVVGALGLIVLALSFVYLSFPQAFDGFTQQQQDTTLSISQINIDPQGNPVGNEWHNSFWNLLVYVNANDDIAGVVLPKGQTGSITYQGAVDALKTGAKVEIKINPQQPYLIRDIQEKTAMVAPGAVGPSKSTGQLDMQYYGWGEQQWRIYTPFVVTVYKDGQQVGQPVTLNEQGASKVQEVSTPEGPVRIENLGTLGGNYRDPNTPSQICIVKGSPNVYDYTQVSSILNSGYGIYWFGNRREGNNVAVNPVMVYPGNIIGNVFTPSNYGGWSGSDVGGKAEPVKPVLFSADKSQLPPDEQKFYCLTQYLQASGVADLSQSIFQSRVAGFTGATWQKVSKVTDSNGATALRLDIPWDAFGTPLVSIRVPTELADTWVERPIDTDTKVSAVWLTTNSLYGDLSGSLRIACTVTNKASITGSSNLEISTGNSKLAVTPLQMTVNNLEPNVPQIVYFDATNLGVEGKIDNIPVTIIAKDTYTGQETGRCTLYGTLLPTLTSGQTTVTIYAVEKGTTIPAKSLQLHVAYGTQSKDVFTDSNGATGGMSLVTPQGGAFVGDVLITSADTATYNAGSMSYPISQAGAYEVTFEVERKDTDYADWLLIALIIGIVIAIIVIVAIAVYLYRKKRKHHRGRHY